MVKRYIYKKIINIKYKKSLKYKERKSIKESQKDIHDFYYQHTPRFKQDIEINPEYDLMIIVPVYNAAEYLEDCIKSLLVQETGYSYCVVFVNDGSTDESANILNKYAKKENVYIINKKNEGVAEARNIALKYIRGKCVLFVDADDMLMDNAIEVLMRKSVETDADRRTGKERADICSDHQSQKKRKVAGAGRFLVGILRACMAAYDSAPPGDYVVLCEGD